MSESTNPLAQQLAEQLRDVHLPDTVSWWPLAIGWWVVFAIVVLATVLLAIFIIRKWQANRYRKTALSELADAHTLWRTHNDTGLYLSSVNDILKKVMLSLGQSSDISKSGSSWIEILNKFAKRPLSDASQQALAFECYAAEPEVDADAVNADVVNWVKTHNVVKASGPVVSSSATIEDTQNA